VYDFSVCRFERGESGDGFVISTEASRSEAERRNLAVRLQVGKTRFLRSALADLGRNDNRREDRRMTTGEETDA